MEAQTRQCNRAKTSSLLVLGVLVTVALLAPVCLGQYYAYVTNEGVGGDGIQDDVSVIDLATNKAIATVPVGHTPQGVVVNPAGTAIYIANSDSNEVTVIDAVTYATKTIPVGVTPVGLAMHPDGRHIYVANVNDTTNTLSVIDRATNTVIDEVFSGNSSIAVALHPDGSVMYVANIFGGSITVVSTETREVIDTIALKPADATDPNAASFPVPIVVHPDGTYVYVADRIGPTVWAINTATHEYVARSFGHNHVGIAINPAGTVLYVPDFNDSPLEEMFTPLGTTVDVLDAKTLERITTIEGLHGPLNVAVHPDGTRLYVTNWGADTVSVIDAATYSLIATIPVGSHPNGFGEFISPGVPRLLLENAVARVQAAKDTIAGDAAGVNSPQLALEQLEGALTSGNASLQADLWSTLDGGAVDPRRLKNPDGAAVFAAGQKMVEAILDALRRGWIVNPELETELLTIVDEVVRAGRVLAAVVIDDAILAQADSAGLDQAQKMLEEADALIQEARVWQPIDKKKSLLGEAFGQYQKAWEAALRLVP